MFANKFKSELRERIQKYTVLDAQSFKDTMICNIDFIEKYMLEMTLHQQEIQKLLTEKKLQQIQEVQSNAVQALKVDSVFIENTCSGKENSNSETAFSKSAKKSSVDSETKDVHAIKYKMSKTQESKVDSGKALNVGLVVTESNGIESEMQDESIGSGNNTDADDSDIRPDMTNN
ncbi:hypothetical protein Tco_0388925 [Tanacetum coccineum]